MLSRLHELRYLQLDAALFRDLRADLLSNTEQLFLQCGDRADSGLDRALQRLLHVMGTRRQVQPQADHWGGGEAILQDGLGV